MVQRRAACYSVPVVELQHELASVASLGSYELRLGVGVSLNPALATAAEATKELAFRLGLFASAADEARYHRSRFVELSAGAYPTAAPEVLRLAELWHFWLFSFDDRTDERDGDLARDVERHERVVTVLLALLDGERAARPDDDVHVRYLDELLAELRALASPRLCRRFAGHVRNYLLHGSMPGALNSLRDQVPPLEEFIPQRLEEGAVYTVLPLVEMAERIDLPDPTVAHPLVQRLQDLANLIVALTNDFFSYEKEVRKNRNPNNLLAVIGKHRGLGFHESVLWALGLIDAYLDEYTRLAGLFGGHADLTRYVRGLSHWICASQKWYLDSGRYGTCGNLSQGAAARR
jgi:hypothetical protein